MKATICVRLIHYKQRAKNKTQLIISYLCVFQLFCMSYEIKKAMLN